MKREFQRILRHSLDRAKAAVKKSEESSVRGFSEPKVSG